MSLRGRQPEAIPKEDAVSFFYEMFQLNKEIATPSKSKSGGSQRHRFMKCTVENVSPN